MLSRKPSIPDIVPLLREYWRQPEHGVGGLFHVVIDDGNIDLHWRKSALEQAKERGDPLEMEIAKMLCAMSLSQMKRLCNHVNFYLDPHEAEEADKRWQHFKASPLYVESCHLAAAV